MDMFVITLPAYMRDEFTAWIAEYDAAVSRLAPSTPEGHEQALMESARLLGAAGALMRILDGMAGIPQPGPAMPGYIPDAAHGADPLAIPANRIGAHPYGSPGFDAFGGPGGDDDRESART